MPDQQDGLIGVAVFYCLEQSIQPGGKLGQRFRTVRNHIPIGLPRGKDIGVERSDFLPIAAFPFPFGNFTQTRIGLNGQIMGTAMSWAVCRDRWRSLE